MNTDVAYLVNLGNAEERRSSSHQKTLVKNERKPVNEKVLALKPD